MTTQLFSPKTVIFLFVLLVLSAYWFYGLKNNNISEPRSVAATSVSSSAPSSSSGSHQVEKENNIVQGSEGVYANSDKSLITVRFARIPRLMVIQQVAEVAGFSFSLPDDAVDYWQESLAVHINNEPLQKALASIIGTKNFSLEVVYDVDIAAHKISAVFLDGKSTKQNVALSPLGRNEPIALERDISDAPAPQLTPDNDSHVKRESFYSADVKTRVALLNEMSPVGDDLNYILTSLQKDDQVAVRIAAAHRLSFSESYLATQSLLDALSDKDESVVKAVINSLVALGDATVLPVIANKFAKNEHMQEAVVDAKNRLAAQYSIASDRRP